MYILYPSSSGILKCLIRDNSYHLNIANTRQREDMRILLESHQMSVQDSKTCLCQKGLLFWIYQSRIRFLHRVEELSDHPRFVVTCDFLAIFRSTLASSTLASPRSKADDEGLLYF